MDSVFEGIGLCADPLKPHGASVAPALRAGFPVQVPRVLPGLVWPREPVAWPPQVLVSCQPPF